MKPTRTGQTDTAHEPARRADGAGESPRSILGIRSRPPGIPSRRRSPLALLTSCVLAGWILGLSGGHAPRDAVADQENGGRRDGKQKDENAEDPGEKRRDEVFICLHGPNDGEPINSRTLLLKVVSNADEGLLKVSANGAFLYSRPFGSGLRYDDASGLYVTEVDVDLDLLQRLFPADFLNPDAAPLTITVALFSTNGSQLISFDDWVGYLGKPWLEVLAQPAERMARDGGRAQAAEDIPLGTLRVLLHPLEQDTFYFLLAAPDRDLLSLSPEDPRLLRHARSLAAGSWPGAGTESLLREIVYIDGVSDIPWRPAYLVLWTFDFYGGWKRSAILGVQSTEP